MNAEIDGPVLDDHMHLDPVHGRGVDAAREFADGGGTHLLVVNKPSWHLLDSLPENAADFREVFDLTVDVVERASEELPGRAWPVLGVHPGLVSQLVDDGTDPEAARDLMQVGLDTAAEYVADGPALALKSGRPHYEVSDAVWDASNDVMKHGFELAAESECAIQLHAESSEDFTDVAEWARDRGLDPERVVKHYSGGRLAGITKSVISHKDELELAIDEGEPFMMETDFVDDPDRPGAVLGVGTVPSRVRWLREQGYDEAIERAHVDTPAAVYGIDTQATLG
ncbi:TatD family hydrolase [Halosimplex litoreum]|uniref:TatD family hydrolase n=1 Tax=Halosimplex litoreum TaxID=1198301 RepID=A0A7T3KU77_9EURY|nr:TatD family hydrolase [Halosimplex litoreum]QPV61977.1 TatD family hydrolase [Halosimplex litoreum]